MPGGYYLTDGQMQTLAHMLEARFDAVVVALGLQRVGTVIVEAQQRSDRLYEEFIVRIPVRRRDYV
jgi:hypothetical protein